MNGHLLSISELTRDDLEEVRVRARGGADYLRGGAA